MKTDNNQVPQIHLRTNLVSGASVDACLNDLDYWTKQLELKCSKKGNYYYPGYPPYSGNEVEP
jgi:hypothetical protein